MFAYCCHDIENRSCLITQNVADFPSLSEVMYVYLVHNFSNLMIITKPLFMCKVGGTRCMDTVLKCCRSTMR
jgi:hypothetical protein